MSNPNDISTEKLEKLIKTHMAFWPLQSPWNVISPNAEPFFPLRVWSSEAGC